MWSPSPACFRAESTSFVVTENIIKLAKGLVDVEYLGMTGVCVSVGLPFVAPIWLLYESPKSSLYPQDFHSHWTACCDWQSLFNGDKCDCWALPLPNHLQKTPVEGGNTKWVCVWRCTDFFFFFLSAFSDTFLVTSVKQSTYMKWSLSVCFLAAFLDSCNSDCWGWEEIVLQI